jgi:lysozyme family protein
MWSGIRIKPGKDDANASFYAKLIIKGEDQYKAVEAATGIPWFFIGALHMRESGCDFKGVLHNGEKIIGTTRKTKLVPKGRGPFKTWVAAAIDALDMRNLRGITWAPARMGYESEGFNGWGYTGKGVNSPYVWAGSNWEQPGKYVADHVWDKDFDDPQIGTMTVLKRLSELRPDVAAALAENHVAPMTTGSVIKSATAVVMNNKKTTAAVTGAAATGTAVASDSSGTLDQLQPILDIFQQHGTTIGLVFTLAIVVGVVGWHFYEKTQTADAAS